MDSKELPKDTVADLISYLQTLPPETKVRVACAVCRGYDVYTEFQALNLDVNVFYLELEGKPTLDIGED